jgi:hypothetical protein
VDAHFPSSRSGAHGVHVLPAIRRSHGDAAIAACGGDLAAGRRPGWAGAAANALVPRGRAAARTASESTERFSRRRGQAPSSLTPAGQRARS